MGKHQPRNDAERAILERAQREYPKGTIYEPMGPDKQVPYSVHRWEVVEREPRIYSQGGDGIIYIKGGVGYIYITDLWAKRKSDSEVKTQDNYLIFT